MEVRERPLSTADLAGTSEREVEKKAEDRSREADAPILMGEATSERPPNQADTDETVPLFSESAVRDFRSKWTALQTGFVDEPRHSVEQADELVARVMKDLAETFSNERSNLERQWEHGDKVSTEDLRLVLRRYRAFFDRFLSV